ncbi:MAG TPA: GAF domain-containing SpoIIE family protein phosphatase, partial [Anaerolineae bacterium]|nr:GAF domain-containing SpoIIE family protein phosphatase [Anaerolineae bacterium]
LLQGIAAQASIAIENARLYEEVKEAYEKEQERTMLLQRSLLPPRIPKIAGIEVATFYESATEAALVGGDFYDVISVKDDLTAFVVGDVSGKGIEAAATTAMVRNTIRSFTYQDPKPSSVLTNANDIVIKQIEPGTFITLIYFLYDRKEGVVTLVNAGHPHPIYCSSKEKACFEFESDDPALSLIPGYQYSQEEVNLLPNDILVLYTDGLIEARQQHEFFGIERAKSIIEKNKNQTVEEITKSLINVCKTFSGGRLKDDIAILVLKRV